MALAQPAAAYLVEGGEVNGSTAYRLYHQALAEHLRTAEREREQQAAVAQALEAMVPALADGSDKAWALAHPYVTEHLATHAAAGAVLDPLVEDPGYLVAADPSRLLLALPSLTAPAACLARPVYRRAFHALRASAPSER